MNSEIQIFRDERFGSIRTINLDGEIWFVGKDVAAALGYKDTVNALKAHVDTEDKQGGGESPPPSGSSRWSSSMRVACTP